MWGKSTGDTLHYGIMEAVRHQMWASTEEKDLKM